MKNIAQKEERKQPKIKTEMKGRGLAVHAGLLPGLTLREKLSFRKRVQEAVRKERGSNAPYLIVDACKDSNRLDRRSNLDNAGCEGIGGCGTDEYGGMERNSCRYHDRTYYEAGNPWGLL